MLSSTLYRKPSFELVAAIILDDEVEATTGRPPCCQRLKLLPWYLAPSSLSAAESAE